MDDKPNMNLEYEKTRDGKYLVKSLECKPYWFKVDVYYDIAKHGETMVLTYNENVVVPVVRIHSEFIFNRFPLVAMDFARFSCICSDVSYVFLLFTC